MKVLEIRAMAYQTVCRLRRAGLYEGNVIMRWRH